MTELERSDEDSHYKPRNYQEQLLGYALKENVIIYLPTGAGKTFIALMAMKEMSKDLEGSLAEGGKRTVFICNTVALARQQFDVIKNYTNLKCNYYTGDMDVDNWKRDKWEIELDKYQVFVSTCQIIVDIIRHKFISVSDFNLMIFDECHHATGNHAMHQLMSEFKYADQTKLPRVIGLTGLLIKSSSKNKMLKELNDLEAVYRAKIVTVANFNEFKNVLIYSTKPKEIVLNYYDTKIEWVSGVRIEQIINKIIQKMKKWCVDETHIKLSKNMNAVRAPNQIKKIENLLIDFLYQMNDMGIYAGSIAIMAVLIEVELKKRAAETIQYRNLLRMVISYIEHIRHIIIDKIYDRDNEDETEYDVIFETSTPKLQQFLLYLEKTFTGKKANDIKCLVFVDRRHTAKVLYHVLKRFLQCNQNIPIKPEFMIGAHDSMPESIECILDNKWTHNILDDFKRNECNLIVASSVLEEGIDVQSCNYVIIFDQFKGFPSYVQTKGRARMNDSIYNIMIPKSKHSLIINKIKDYKEMDITLKEYLIGKTIDRTIPLPIETQRQFEEVIVPFETSIGARLVAESAVPLINRYCMGLPNDSFTRSAVQYAKEDLANGKYKVKIILPLQSTVKEDIWSDEMESIKWAKRSAAFKACKLLYEKGEFSEHLLPITLKKQIELMTPIYFKHWEQYSNDNAKQAGTKKKRRLHQIQYPSQLCAATPVPSIQSYMYTIYLVPTFERSNDNSNSYIIDSLSTKYNFAILSKKLLPKIAEMTLFMSQGPIKVNISPYAGEIIIPTKDDLQKLRNFHTMIFRDLLQIWPQYYCQDYRNEENSYIIVPTLNQNEINWELVNNFQNLTNVCKLSEMQRRKMNIIEEDYLNKIVCTWYHADDTVRYIVKAIHKDITPLSPFPHSDHETYASYIEDKYGETVIQNNCFLIEVQQITSRINFLTTGRGDGSKKKSKKFDSILLIPELCHNFRFPGDVWIKAKFLPSILHRLHYILIAEELRIKINHHIGIKHENYIPLPLIVDYSLRRVNNTIDTDKEIITLRSLTSGIDAKPITGNKSLIETNKYKWREYEEPCDIDRYIDNLYKIEIDYYHQFITNKLKTIKINENFNTNQFDILNDNDTAIDIIPAICDVTNDERKKIEILKLTNEFNNNKGPEQCDLLAAITTAGSNDVFDMERLEVLGDSFLKFSISLFLLHCHQTWNEGYLTIIKGRIVSNRNLLYHSINLKLPGALKSKMFEPKNEWRPPICSIPLNALELFNKNDVSPSVFGELILNDEESQNGLLNVNTLNEFYKNFKNHPNHTGIESDMYYLLNKMWITDKVCADSVEAILGVCVKTFGIKKTFSILEFFNIIPSNKDIKNILNINLGNPRLRTNISDHEIDSFLLNYKDLEKNLCYKFKDRAYLLQALTHPSYPTNRITGCYQQLEFIGDAILDFLITCYIYERCDKMDPGKLTDLRSALVNNVTLASIAVRHKFHLFILSQNASLSQSIMKFVEFQHNQDYKVTNQVRILILESECSKTSMADYVDVPKTLGDIFESLIGAVFLDSGNNLEITWNVIYHLIHQELFEFMNNVPIQVVRQLYEFNGANPTFSEPIIDDEIIMIKCGFTCRNDNKEVNGFGKNKNQAKISAAKLALQHLLQA